MYLDGRGGGEKLGGVDGGKTVFRFECMEENLFNKRKKIKNKNSLKMY